MLKLTPQKKSVFINYQVRQSRFNRDFFIALLIAISFHVSLGALFRIKDSAHQSGVFFPFTEVVAEVEKGSLVTLFSQQKSCMPWMGNSAPEVPAIQTSKLQIDFSHFSEKVIIDFSAQETLNTEDLLGKLSDD